MDLDKYQVTEEQMLNALRQGIKETLTLPKEYEDEVSKVVEVLRDYKKTNTDAEIYIETKYGTISQKLSECEIYSPNGQNIVFIWK